MMGAGMNRALVLNKHWIPVNVVGVEKAFKLLFTGRASCLNYETFLHHDLDSWIDISEKLSLPKIKMSRMTIAIPELLLLDDYSGIPHRRVTYSKRNVIFRDKFICQYCGKRCSDKEVTVDHVLPKCKGGKSAWDNIVTACLSCNQKKNDKTVEQAGMYPLKTPREPRGTNPLFCLSKTDSMKESWKKFLFTS